MRIPKQTIRKRLDAFIDSCRERGVKVTHQRLEIFREVASASDHPDAGAVYKRVRKRMPTVSLDTVYRNLRLLEDHGLIAVAGINQERLRFDGNAEPHHHFVCIECGRMDDLQWDPLARLALPGEAQAFGEPLSLHIEVRGLCKQCKRPNRTG